MSGPLPAITAVPVQAAPESGGPGLRLYRMPLVWVAVGVPALFLFYLAFLSPSL